MLTHTDVDIRKTHLKKKKTTNKPVANFSFKKEKQQIYRRGEMSSISCISVHCQSFSLEREGLNRRWGHSLLYMITKTRRLPVKAHLSSATIKQLCLCWPADHFILNHPVIRTNTLTQTQTHLLCADMAWQWYILGNSRCYYRVGRELLCYIMGGNVSPT